MRAVDTGGMSEPGRVGEPGGAAGAAPRRDVAAVVLAAGLGTRMRSDLVKVLHRLAGRPLVLHVLDAVRGAGVGEVAVVVGHQAEAVRQAVGASAVCVVQDRPLGTGHAVLAARDVFARYGSTLVVYGDTPLLSADLLAGLLAQHRRGRAAATLLTAVSADATGYGRILRGPDGRVAGIVEEADATPEQRAIREWNTGIGCYRSRELLDCLGRVGTGNARGEMYLTDVVGLLAGSGRRVEAVVASDDGAVRGVNDRRDLAAAEEALCRRALDRLLAAGVTVIDPATTRVDPRAEVGRDTVLHPFTQIEGPSRIGPGCDIGPGSRVVDSRLGPGVRVVHSLVEGSVLESGVSVGPFTHVPPGSRAGRGARLGAPPGAGGPG